MVNMFYLLNISVAGVKNLKKEVKVDFYKKTVDKNFDPDKYRVKAIYGENGSGKSAIITAVKIFQDLLINENYLNESKTQIFLSEIINKSMQKMFFRCEFLVDIDADKNVYDYQVHIGKMRVGNMEFNTKH